MAARYERSLSVTNRLRPAIALHRFLQEFQRRSLVARLGDIGLQHLAFVVDGAPQIMGLSVDLYEDLIEAPASLTHLAQLLRPALLDVPRHQRAEPVPPVRNRLMGYVDAALMEQILQIPQR